ncbi:MAG TPA: ROK family protein [Verrucomicrobiae bacterium]|jgi:glucokinase|nr:ROK family protein [Verrucomicrobiae bacterium]
MKPATVGIDVGGTKTLCVLLDKHFQLLEEIKFKTAPEEGRHRFTRRLIDSVGALVNTARAKGLETIAVGIGSAGSVDEKEIRIKTSPNLMMLENFPIGKYLSKVVKATMTIGNDVQTGLHGEHKLGAAKGCSHIMGVFFGTGVGGAVIINNKLYSGASGFGGQVGGLVAQPVGGPMAALSHGIVDRIASKSAIASEALVMAIKNWAPYLHREVGTDLSKITWGILERAIKHGDKRIEEMLRARMRVVGIALANVVNFMNPEMLVLGGGLMDQMRALVTEEIENGLREYLTPEVSKAIRIKPAKLGGHAVAIGAAHQALKAALSQAQK